MIFFMRLPHCARNDNTGRLSRFGSIALNEIKLSPVNPK
jgi:hypothetical protein